MGGVAGIHRFDERHRHLVAADLDGAMHGQLRAQRRGAARGAGGRVAQLFGQAQETVHAGASAHERLPQQHPARTQSRRGVEREQAAEAQAPQGQGARIALRQPVGGQGQVLVPDFPAARVEFATAVAAGKEVDLQDRVAEFGESARLQCRHAPGTVEFFREGMDIEDGTAWRHLGVGGVIQAEARARRGIEEEGLHAGRGQQRSIHGAGISCVIGLEGPRARPALLACRTRLIVGTIMYLCQLDPRPLGPSCAPTG
nr:hypothetical protein [Massilia sp. Se16.2.3]